MNDLTSKIFQRVGINIGVALVGKLTQFVGWQLSCSLTVYNNDEAFTRVSAWLAALDYAKSCRRFRLSSMYSQVQERTVEILSPGEGAHFFWYKKRPVIVSRGSHEGALGLDTREYITVCTVGLDRTLIRELVEEISSVDMASRKGLVEVYVYRHQWLCVNRKPKRSIDTVVLPKEVKQTLLDDIERFQRSRDWYAQRAVPYRRGFLLEGPPGCGKTSLVFAIASLYERPIYALNLGSLHGDDALVAAVCEVPENGILLIEDVDAARVVASRVPEAPKELPFSNKAEEPKGVSLSALLNVIDGVVSREGRLLFMTTNHPEKIDAALLRPGRVDRRLQIVELERDGVETMCGLFLPESEARSFAARVPVPISAAELQGRLLDDREPPWSRASEASKKKDR